MKKPVFMLLCFSLTQALMAKPLTLEDLQKRIEDLEKQQEQLLLEASEPRPMVNSFLNDNLTFGGFFEPGYTTVTGPDTDLQSASSNFLGINLAADFQSHFRFVAQFLTAITVNMDNPHNDPRANLVGQEDQREFKNVFFGSSLTQGYIEYIKSRAFNVQMGLGYVPFGYALQQRELVLFIRRGGPQILRTSELVSPLWSGFNIYGSVPWNKKEVGYNLYTFTPSNRRAPGVGARGWAASEDRKITGGISVQVGKSDIETAEIVGTDIKLDLFPVVIVAEYAQHISKEQDPWSIYVEPSIYILNEELLLYVFGDYANSSLNETGSGSVAISDPYAKWEYGLGLNWLPTSYTRFRLGLTFYDYVGKTSTIMGQNRDYTGIDLSAGIAF